MEGKFKTHKFHTKWLIPEKVIDELENIDSEEGKAEHIMIWQDAYQSHHHFNEGEICAHIWNPKTKMIVEKIARHFPKPQNGEKSKSKIDGIVVHWFEHDSDKYV